MRRRSLSQSPGRVFYGWWIVAIGCVQDAVKGGLFNTGFTLYFLPVLTELNLSRAATSLPFSLSRLEAARGAAAGRSKPVSCGPTSSRSCCRSWRSGSSCRCGS